METAEEDGDEGKRAGAMALLELWHPRLQLVLDYATAHPETTVVFAGCTEFHKSPPQG